MASDSKAKLLREGEKYVQQGKISHAIGEYLKIVKIDPDDVLTLNTIGDLYLRQGRVPEAKQIFFQVADNYTRNNFLLKAIAVYKKILTTDSGDPEVSLLIASLYARQGMNVNARAQYLRVAELFERQGKSAEALEAYEKAVEIDPMNAAVQLKLAKACYDRGETEKARNYFAGAASAQAKAGDFERALGALRRAVELDPADTAAVKNFLEMLLQADAVPGMLDSLKKLVGGLSPDVALEELMGRACLAGGDLENAEANFQAVLAEDDAKHDLFLDLGSAYLAAGDLEGAVRSLEAILPALIQHREMGKAADCYQAVQDGLTASSKALEGLAGIFSAVQDEPRCLDCLDRAAECRIAEGDSEGTLALLEKILQINPVSERHLEKHRELFAALRPDVPYALPPTVVEAACRKENSSSGDASGCSEDEGEEKTASTIVEIDLLLNYGMKEKALRQLLGMEAADPFDREVRSRLISIYREEGELSKAAEQCALMAALHSGPAEEESRRKFLAESAKLDPDLTAGDFDLAAFAGERGIGMESEAGGSADPEHSGVELDLSGDLSEIFFNDGSDAREDEPVEPPPSVADPIADEFPAGIPETPAPETIEEQLQEVDFYIRLGFNDEAQAKLDEIAREHPDHPELEARYRQLKDGESEPGPAGVRGPEEETDSLQVEDADLPGSADETPDPEIAAGADREGAFELVLDSSPSDVDGLDVGEIEVLSGFDSEAGPQDAKPAEEPFPELEAAGPSRDSGAVAAESVPAEVSAVSPAGADGNSAGEEPPANAMFADLFHDADEPSNRQVVREDYETHFSLGIAYREMGLLDEAIQEFQSSVKALDSVVSPKEMIQCCGMLCTCFLEKGMPRSAIRWCQAGLSVADISSHESTALRYDMGVAHSAAGDSDRALECFGEVFSVDPGYRDVAQRIDELKSGLERHAP